MSVVGFGEVGGGVVGAAEDGVRGSQNIARARRRRRRPNIVGSVHTVAVTLSGDEFRKLKQAAEEAGSTLPWYLARCALHPAPAGSKGPWLPWPKRQVLVSALMSAAKAMDELRLQHLGRIGSNLNQVARIANTDGVLAEDITDLLAELDAAVVELRERAERIEELAAEAGRR